MAMAKRTQKITIGGVGLQLCIRPGDRAMLRRLKLAGRANGRTPGQEARVVLQERLGDRGANLLARLRQDCVASGDKMSTTLRRNLIAGLADRGDD